MRDRPRVYECMSCQKPIRVNPDAGLGEPRYVHDPAVSSSHMAIRGPGKREVEGDG